MTETQLTNPIKKFSQQSNSITYVGNFGADADNIQITLTDGQNPPEIILQTNLLDFFKNWQDFKETNAFMYHGDISIEDMDNLDQQVRFLYRFNKFDVLKYKLSQKYPNAIDISKYFHGKKLTENSYLITLKESLSSNIPDLHGRFACLITDSDQNFMYFVFDFLNETYNINDYRALTFNAATEPGLYNMRLMHKDNPSQYVDIQIDFIDIIS